jgi:aryl-alcohol dehydrogenase-like predicted oxidoreductase
MKSGCLAPRRLGSSGIDVSGMSLGSWRTYERIPRDDGVAVLRAARELGITFFDDARYDDETGSAPIPTGYSEVVFGEVFRAAGLRRDEVAVANKLWWEFWPEQDAAAELDGSLGRMRFGYVDLIYASAPRAGMSVSDLVSGVGGLLSSGRARAWGMLNWPAGEFLAASRAAAELGVPQPCAAQLPYSLVQRSPVDDQAVVAALAACGAGVVASYCLAGGVLTGKYSVPGADELASGPASGRASGTLADPRVGPALAAARELAALAAEAGTSAAALALAFPLANPAVSSVLFGATSPQQVRANCEAVALLDRLGPDERARLLSIGAPGS